ncbi:hypothetical protein ACF3DV_00395 [Chlorogloeopsis fritschii PCC 9212]|nr:hypothetical protein [Chlorogloeopsis fritschii]
MQIIEYSVITKSACRAFVDGEAEIWNLTLPVLELPKGLPFGPNAIDECTKYDRSHLPKMRSPIVPS